MGKGELRDCDEDHLPKRQTDWDSEGWEFGLRDGYTGSRATRGLRCECEAHC